MSNLSPAETKTLVEQLYDHRTRREARLKLARGGAYDALIECLNSNNESVVWAAAQSLGDAKVERAAPALVEVLERGTLPFEVAAALRSITGKTYGVDANQWKRFLSGGVDAEVESKLDFAKVVEETAHTLGMPITGADRSFEIKLTLPNGRSQRVYVHLVDPDETEEDDELVAVYSECGPAEERHYENLLRRNLQMQFGAFAIRDIKGATLFVIVDTSRLAELTVDGLAVRVNNLGDMADRVERSLARHDSR